MQMLIISSSICGSVCISCSGQVTSIVVAFLEPKQLINSIYISLWLFGYYIVCVYVLCRYAVSHSTLWQGDSMLHKPPMLYLKERGMCYLCIRNPPNKPYNVRYTSALNKVYFNVHRWIWVNPLHPTLCMHHHFPTADYTQPQIHSPSQLD